MTFDLGAHIGAMDEDFSALARWAIDEGMDGALLLDKTGVVVGEAGLCEDDVSALRGVVTRGLRGAGLIRNLLAGEHHVFAMDEREARVIVAGRCLFVLLVYQPQLRRLAEETLSAARTRAEAIVGRFSTAPPRTDDGGEGGSAELELAELGVTPGLVRGKA